MLAWASLSLQVFLLDSAVNLLAALLASLAAAWSLVAGQRTLAYRSGAE
jgi:hypothetical protein